MNDVVKSRLGLQNLVESSRCSNIDNVNEMNTFFPCWVKGEDSICLGRRSDRSNDLIFFLSRLKYQSVRANGIRL